VPKNAHNHQLLQEFDLKAKAKSFRFLFGVDEAGRGPLAGPVAAAAVCLRNSDFVNRVDDSKKLSPRQRAKAFEEIFERGWVGIGLMNEKVIDEVNILRATHLAMTAAVKDLCAHIPPGHLDEQSEERSPVLPGIRSNDAGGSSLLTRQEVGLVAQNDSGLLFRQNPQVKVLIDGNSYQGGIPFKIETVIEGDAKSLSIACASIVAKVYRDRLMEKYDRLYPGYGFRVHKGYPTAVHREALRRLGYSPIHRRTFHVS
jgi:ribonuclease HII